MSVTLMTTEGAVVVVSGPSGGGKSTICRRLCKAPGFRFSVSATTRDPRDGERDGVDYHFVTREAFEAMRKRGELIEHSEHFGQLYGTPRQGIEEALARGEKLILEIDINGAEQIVEAMPDARTIFVVAPSPEELERRLRSRDTEGEEAIKTRLARSDIEMARGKSFGMTVVNDDADRATAEVQHWIQAEVNRSNG